MLLDELNQKIVLFFQYAFNAFNLEDPTNSDEDEGTRQFVDFVVKDQNALATMQTTMALFNNLTKYTMTKFEDLTLIYNMFMWNWAKLTLCDDMLFIASCIYDALTNEIHQPTSHKKVVLGNQLQKLSNHFQVNVNISPR